VESHGLIGTLDATAEEVIRQGNLLPSLLRSISIIFMHLDLGLFSNFATFSALGASSLFQSSGLQWEHQMSLERGFD